MENQSQSLSVPSASVQPEIPMPVTPQELKAITGPEVLILANGPEGEPPRPVEDLVNLLKREPLDMNFYPFAHPVGGGYLIQGNILDGRHRFIVRGTAKVLGELLEAIEANIRKFHRAHPVFRNDRVRAYLQKRSARAAWLEERAARKEREGTALLKGAREIASFIPFGQPILVGHHSERRHRRDLDRIHSKTSRGFQLQDQAAALRARAVSIEVDDGQVKALEAALDNDDTVVAYEATGTKGGRYEVYPIADEYASDINRGRLIFASDSLEEATNAAEDAYGWVWSTAVLDTLTRKIDFGHGFGVPIPKLED